MRSRYWDGRDTARPREQVRARKGLRDLLLAHLAFRDAELGAGACAERAYSDYRVVAEAGRALRAPAGAKANARRGR